MELCTSKNVKNMNMKNMKTCVQGSFSKPSWNYALVLTRITAEFNMYSLVYTLCVFSTPPLAHTFSCFSCFFMFMFYMYLLVRQSPVVEACLIFWVG